MTKGRPSKLTEVQKAEIIELRLKYKISYPELAARYGVSPHTIMRICRPESYELNKKSNHKYRMENQKIIQQKNKQTYRRYQIAFHLENDAEIIGFLDKKKNIQDYVRQCVARDMRSEKSDRDPAEEKSRNKDKGSA